MKELSQEFNDYLLLQENELQSSITDDLKGNDGRYLGDLLWNHIHNIITRNMGHFAAALCQRKIAS
jgi:hypothetical protein